MIVYLDTSALVKLYVEEEGSDEVEAVVSGAALIGTSVIAYPELRSAIARRTREGHIGAEQALALVEQIDRDWQEIAVVGVTEPLALNAGELAHNHALRGFDAIHLAGALMLRGRFGADVQFLGFDRRLSEAATAEGFTAP